jgi:hypothetical protein
VTPEEAVLDQLLATSAVTDLVGQRVYQLMLPEHGTLPAIRVQLIDDPELYHLRGNMLPGYAMVQVDSYARRSSGGDPYLEVATVGAAVNSALTVEGWQVGSPPRYALGVFRKRRRPLFEGEELQHARIWQDYLVISAQL